MKVPQEMNMYCPTCNKHTGHMLKLGKFSSASSHPLAKYQRRYAEKICGYGGTRKGESANKSSKKGTKRYAALAKCKVCGKSVYRKLGRDMTRVTPEIIRK